MPSGLELRSSNPASAPSFGSHLALGDGVLAITGLPASSVVNFVIHVRERDAGGQGQWGEVQRISATRSEGPLIGPLTIDGDRLVAVAEPNPLRYALRMFRRDQGGAGQWGLERSLSFPIDAQGFFRPREIELRGEWLVAGDWTHGVNGLETAGAVFLFHRDTGGPDLLGTEGWGPVTRLFTGPRQRDTYFGSAVSIEDDELLVGARSDRAGGGIGDVRVLDLRRVARATWRNDAAGLNPNVYRVLASPRIGTDFVAQVDLAASGHGLAVLATYLRRAEIPLSGARVQLGRGLLSLHTAAGPLAHFSIPMPADAGLCGREVTTQARLFGGSLPPALSNAQDLRLGFQ